MKSNYIEQNNSNVNIQYSQMIKIYKIKCVYLLYIYKYTHMHVYICYVYIKYIYDIN